MTIVLIFKNFYLLIILSFFMVVLSYLRVVELVDIVLDAFKSILNEFIVLNILKRVDLTSINVL